MPYEELWSPSDAAYVATGWNRNRSWVRTANYSSITKKGDLPINPYSDYTYRTQQGLYGGNWYVDNATGAVSVVEAPHYRLTVGVLRNALQNFVTSFQISKGYLIEGPAAHNRALVKALGKTADAKVNLAVSLAEAHKTSTMILDSASRIYKAFRSFKRGNLKGVAENLNITPRRLHNNWLAYKYGWMPLLNEVKGAAEFFAQQSLGGRPPRFSVSATETLSHEQSGVVGMHNPIGTLSVPVTRSHMNESKFRVKIWLEVTNPAFNQLQQLGLTNPAEVAWELVPFSFVFDWFISVGDYLKGLTALHGVTVLKAMRSTKTTYSTSTYWPPGSKNEGSSTSVDAGGDYGGTISAYERASLAVDPGSTYPPRNQAVFGFDRTVTSLALLRALASGGSNTYRR